MSSFGNYILTALSLVFVIEGLVYALFPETVKKMLAMALTLPTNQLRLFGLLVASTGFGFVWILSRL